MKALIRIFMADDHRLFRTGLRLLLERMSDVVITGEAEDGLQALDALRADPPDLALLDISMPGLNGIELTRRLRECCPALRIVMLSMHGERTFVLESLRAGADGYLLKDAGFDELARVIREVHRGNKAVSSGVSTLLVEELLHPVATPEEGAWKILTARERQVLQLLAEGRSTREMAGTLNLSAKTVESHRKQLMDKLDLHSVAELTKYAIREGLTQL